VSRRIRPQAAPPRPGRIRGALRALAATALLVVVVAGAWQGWRQLDSPVAVVRIEGQLTEVERGRAQRLVAAQLPAGVLSLDTRRLRDRLEAESWIDTAAVRRRWPDTLLVSVAPEVPVARWRDGALLSNRGEVIEPLELVGVDALPHLSGPAGSAGRLAVAFQRVAEVLRPLGLSVVRLEEDAGGDVRFVTDTGLLVELGTEAHVDRLRRLDTVLRARLLEQLDRVARIDARYDNGVAVAWRDVVLPGLGPNSVAALAAASDEGP
jgi:cell division protein FtsQ